MFHTNGTTIHTGILVSLRSPDQIAEQHTTVLCFDTGDMGHIPLTQIADSRDAQSSMQGPNTTSVAVAGGLSRRGETAVSYVPTIAKD